VSRLREVFAKRTRRTIWSMTRLLGEFLDLDPSDPSVAADVVLRQQPDEEEEDDEEDDGKAKKKMKMKMKPMTDMMTGIRSERNLRG